MGLFSFVRDAGKALFGGAAKADEPEAAEAVLKKEIEAAGVDPSKFSARKEGDKVILTGDAADQAERERAVLAVGNIEGVAEVEESVTVATPERESTFHTVEKGDTLWAIAAKHYGDGSKYQKIFEANTPMLSDPDKIYPGQKLRIPAA